MKVEKQTCAKENYTLSGNKNKSQDGNPKTSQEVLQKKDNLHRLVRILFGVKIATATLNCNKREILLLLRLFTD